MADPVLADVLVEGLYDGVPLRQLCRDNGISKSAVYRWFDSDEALAGRISRARELGYHQIAEECLEIADSDDDPASRRVRVETRLKLLSKWDPRRYGDKLALGGAEDLPAIKTETTVPKLQRLLAAGLSEEAALRLLASPEADTK